MEIKNTMYIIWAIVIVGAIVLEMVTVMQIGWAAAIAGLFALITNIFVSEQVYVQIIVFILSWSALWIVLFLLLKQMRTKWAKNDDGFRGYINKTYEAVESNIDSKYGVLAIDDKKYRFISEDKINVGDTIKVISLSGVTMTVKAVKKERK